MKRILRFGTSALFSLMALLAQAEGAANADGANRANLSSNRLEHENFVASVFFLRHGCSHKLQITFNPANAYSAEQKSALLGCVAQERDRIGAEAIAGLKRGDLQSTDVGQFVVTESLRFAQQYSAKARAQDPDVLLEKAREEGRRTYPFKP